METSEKIIKIAINEFSSYGVKSVTMDQIARKAGISKKTLYREFADKRQLVFESFSKVLGQNAETLRKMECRMDGVIEHLIEFSKFIRERFTDMHPVVLYEIKRYYPDIWALFEDFKEDYAIKNLVNLMEKGKELGYFRPEINSRLLAIMRFEQISILLDPTKFNLMKANLGEIQVQLFEHFLYGIFSEKGRRAYQEHLNHQL